MNTSAIDLLFPPRVREESLRDCDLRGTGRRSPCSHPSARRARGSAGWGTRYPAGPAPARSGTWGRNEPTVNLTSTTTKPNSADPKLPVPASQNQVLPTGDVLTPAPAAKPRPTGFPSLSISRHPRQIHSRHSLCHILTRGDSQHLLGINLISRGTLSGATRKLRSQPAQRAPREGRTR